MSHKQSSNLSHNLDLGILVDPQDLDLLETYRFYNVGGYAVATLYGSKHISLATLVHSRMTGKCMSEYTPLEAVSHIENIPMDCRTCNIFEKTISTVS